MTAFCTCRRFSASSHDHAARALEHLGGDLLAAVGGQAVQHDRIVRAHARSGVVQLPGREHLCARLCLGLAAHRDPGVGGEHVGVRDGLGGVGDEGRGAAGGPAISAARARTSGSGA